MKNFHGFRAKMLLLLMGFMPLVAAAQEGDNEDKKNYGHAGIGFAADSWNVEFGYTRMFCPFVGIGASALVDWEYDGKSFLDLVLDDDTYDDYDDSYITRFALVPQLTFRTPTLHILRKQEDRGDGLLLQVEPGVMLCFPANDTQDVPDWSGVQLPKETGKYYVVSVPQVRVKNHGGEWCYWRLKTSLCYKGGPGMIALSYACSNYSIFDCRRNMRLYGERVHNFPNRKLNHTVTLSLSVGF